MTDAERKTAESPYFLQMPEGECGPLFLDSPHSCTTYPADFRYAANLPLPLLRQAEDTFVEQLYADAPARGIPLLAAGCPRSYLDANRGLEEIDEALLDAPWPGLKKETSKTRLGKGLVWRVLDTGEPIYDRKLGVAELQARIDNYYLPYYAQLQKLSDQAVARHGHVFHINCHSMPSEAAKFATEHPGLQHPDLGSAVGERIRKGLVSGGYVRLVDTANQAEAVLKIGAESSTKTILSLSGAGRVTEYRLVYRVSYSISYPDGRPWINADQIELTRDYTYQDAAFLAKSAEEALLYRDMHDQAAQQILRRLRSLKPQPAPVA